MQRGSGLPYRLVPTGGRGISASTHVEDTESLGTGHSLGGPPLLVEPAGQGVGPQVLAHDQVCDACVGEMAEPGEQHFVQGRLPDADRRVRPDLVETLRGVDLLRSHGH